MSAYRRGYRRKSTIGRDILCLVVGVVLIVVAGTGHLAGTASALNGVFFLVGGGLAFWGFTRLAIAFIRGLYR